MQIFIDANNQVMAFYRGCRGDPTSWPGTTEAEAPDEMPPSRDLKVTLDKDGGVTGWEASVNPVQPVRPAPVKDRAEQLADLLVAKGVITEEEKPVLTRAGR